MSADDLLKRLEQVRTRVRELCKAVTRDADSVDILAVSKTHDAAVLRVAFAAGVRAFGENYAQEMCAKAEALADLAPRWVYIGTLQSNKITQIVRLASEIQSVSDLRHAQLISRAAASAGKAPYPIYIGVNAGSEMDKSGIALAEVRGFAAALAGDSGLRLRGIMAIPPPQYSDDMSGGTVPPLYRELRLLADDVGEGALSLGMTGDMGIAIAAGSTCLRIGTAIFGAREPKLRPALGSV